jgi:hypothetical protein
MLNDFSYDKAHPEGQEIKPRAKRKRINPETCRIISFLPRGGPKGESGKNRYNEYEEHFPGERAKATALITADYVFTISTLFSRQIGVEQTFTPLALPISHPKI